MCDVPVFATCGKDRSSLRQRDLLDRIAGVYPYPRRQLVVRIAVVSNLQVRRLIAESLNELVYLRPPVSAADRPKRRLLRDKPLH